MAVWLNVAQPDIEQRARKASTPAVQRRSTARQPRPRGPCRRAAQSESRKTREDQAAGETRQLAGVPQAHEPILVRPRPFPLTGRQAPPPALIAAARKPACLHPQPAGQVEAGPPAAAPPRKNRPSAGNTADTLSSPSMIRPCARSTSPCPAHIDGKGKLSTVSIAAVAAAKSCALGPLPLFRKRGS